MFSESGNCVRVHVFHHLLDECALGVRQVSPETAIAPGHVKFTGRGNGKSLLLLFLRGSSISVDGQVATNDNGSLTQFSIIRAAWLIVVDYDTGGGIPYLYA